MAFMTAGADPMVPASPTPFTPSELVGEGVTEWPIAIGGTSLAAGSAEEVARKLRAAYDKMLTPYDLLLRGGHVIDPAPGLDGVADIAVKDGRIAALLPPAPGESAGLVLPPLVDGHIHIHVDNLLADGDFVVVQGHGVAMTKRGVAYNNTYCWVYRFEQGQIKALTEYLDTELVTRAFG